jgi:NarL family two-component system response regulator LiaR
VTAASPVKVLIVDDQAIVRTGLRSIILAFEDLELAGVAASGPEAVEMYRRLAPDVVLMDLVMPDQDGIVTIQEIHRESPWARIIALSNFGDDALIRGAIGAGAVGYLLKNVTAEDLRAAILAANAGRPAISPEVTQILASVAGPSSPTNPALSEREREVLTLLVKGLSNSAIAERLSISRSTVKFHVGSIFLKLGTTSRTEAVARAVQLRLVRVES